MQAPFVITLELPKPPSLNEYYSSKHWTSRKKTTDKMRGAISLLLLEQGQPPFEVTNHHISLEVNSRRDIDNEILAIKYLNDTMEKDLKWITADSPKYFNQMSIYANKDLPKETWKATIFFYGEG